jgi:hypothetical protein
MHRSQAPVSGEVIERAGRNERKAHLQRDGSAGADRPVAARHPEDAGVACCHAEPAAKVLARVEPGEHIGRIVHAGAHPRRPDGGGREDDGRSRAAQPGRHVVEQLRMGLGVASHGGAVGTRDHVAHA